PTANWSRARLAETISFNQYAAALPHRQSLLRNLLAIESDRAARGTCRDKMRAKAGCGAVRQGTDDQPISVRTCAMISRRKQAQTAQQGPKTGFDGDPGQTHPIYRRSAAQVEAELCLLLRRFAILNRGRVRDASGRHRND